MALTPSIDACAAGFEAGQNWIGFTRLAAKLDALAPLILKLARTQRNAFKPSSQVVPAPRWVQELHHLPFSLHRYLRRAAYFGGAGNG